ncbi:MAG: ERCC4 domain-containing protein [Planctomycetes bacterium]|nr:ERCC4 domain-containing protein [Planctomycetota bacterium]
MKFRPVVIIDTREQRPWRFENLETQRVALTTGDYSIRGLTHLVSVERKSLGDLFHCVGRDRDRFKRELSRLRGFRFRALIIEATLAEIEAGQWRSKLQPAHVLGSLTAWTVQFGLPIVFAGDHAAAGRYAQRYLFQAARTVASECAAIQTMNEADTKTAADAA